MSVQNNAKLVHMAALKVAYLVMRRYLILF